MRAWLRRFRVGAIVGLVVGLVAVFGVASACSANVELPVSFNVQLVNTSPVVNPSDLCPSSTTGPTVTVVGHLVEPGGILKSKFRTGTLYLHGFALNESLFYFTAVPKYNLARQLAENGHTSITIDRIGYGGSYHPASGLSTCMGVDISVTTQILSELRSGNYTLGGGAGVSFQRLALAGHSGTVDESSIIAATSPSLVDGVIQLSWSDTQANEPFHNAILAVTGANCQTSSDGYAMLGTDSQQQQAFRYNMDPAVVAAITPQPRDPCGNLASLADEVPVNLSLVSQVHDPVFIMIGDHDAFFPASSAADTASRFTGSKDVRYKVLKNVGHDLFLNRNAGQAVDVLNDWLDNHGF
jgi:pimeloyl-ACP methyl ester carboxylesterase